VKRLLQALLLGIVLLALVMGVQVTATAAAELGELVISDVSWRPRSAFPGDEVLFRVTYENASDTAVTDERPVTLQLIVQTRDSAAQQVAVLERPMGSLAGLGPRASGTVTGTLLTPSAGQYDAVARLLAGEQILDEHREPFPVESALPPTVVQLFAGLGMFIAVVTMMALGTEVVVDSLKFFIGLKRKVTAMEALDRLERELPGELSALGVKQATTEEFKRFAQDLKATVQPVDDATQMVAQIRQGAFGDAYAVLLAMAPQTGAITEAELARLKAPAQAAIRRGILTLQTRLNLPSEQTAELEAYLLAQIEGATVGTAASLAEEMAGAIQAWAPQATEQWLVGQVDTVLHSGRARLTARIDADLLPVLEGLGLDRETARAHLVEALNDIEASGRQSSLTYIASVQNLLKGVEARRNAMQSPLRKIYRRLRESQLGLGAVLAGIAGAVVVGVLLLWGLSGGGLGAGEFLATVLLAVLAGGGLAFLTNRRPQTHEFGDALRALEHQYNRLLGRADQPKEAYGEVEKAINERIDEMGLTSVARILMEREDKHRDEESSRLRVLRVISLIAGVILAYLLQIDAALLLDEAVPGIGRTINAFLDITPHDYWGALPEHGRLTAGIILTGLAASAGSAFWHDQLGRLQGAKEQAEAAAKLLRRARDLPEDE